MPLFSTNFAPPPALALTLEADLDASAIRLTWPATAIVPEDFGGYRVQRRVENEDWVLLAEYNSPSSTSHTDYAAPLNRTVTYRLTQFSIDVESDPSDASTALLDNRWWVVSPGDASMTFPVPKVRSASLTSPVVQEAFSPIGRPGKLVVGDVVQAEDGQISFLVMPDNPGMLALLRAVQGRMSGELLLKAPDGGVHPSRIGSISRAFTAVPGLQELSLPFTGTA